VPDTASYEVHRSATEGGAYTQTGGTITGTAYTDPELTPDTVYWYKVKAVNQDRKSDFSTPVSRRTPAIPRGHYFVRQDGAGAGNGTSWGNASGDLQAMIEKAYAKKGENGGVAVVHVGAGTYKPQKAPTGYPVTMTPSPGDNRDKSFFLRPGVQVLGGYTAAGEYGIDDAARHARFDGSGKVNNPQYQAILSGDFAGDDGGTAPNFTGMTENAYHVVISLGVANSQAVLDGITIQGGNANGSGYVSIGGKSIYRVYGGGIYDYADGSGAGPYSLVLANVTIASNHANSFGGGGYLLATNAAASSPVLTRVTIAGNTANNGGGLTIAASSGAAGSPVLTNVTIAGNAAGSSGGGLYRHTVSTSASALLIRNSIIWGNTAPSQPQILSNNVSAAVRYSIVEAASAWTGVNNSNANPNFVDLQKATTGSPTSAGDYRLSTDGNPPKNAGLDSNYPSAPYAYGNWQTWLSGISLSTSLVPQAVFDAYIAPALSKDLGGAARRNGTIDMGAYEK
jgi:hypothetical protein